MSFADENGGGGSATPPADTSPETTGQDLPNGLPPNDPNGEGTTAEEVAATLKSAGITLPDEPPTVTDESEEGDDPDAPATDSEPDAPAETEEEPADEPDETEETDIDKVELNTTDADKYSFEVTDANGVTFKIPADAKMEDILAEFEPKNNGQILDILSQLQDLKAQKATDDKAEAENTAKAEQAQRVSEIRKGWDSEVKDLSAQKRIPSGEDGETRINEVYKFMGSENDKRIKEGRPTIGSFEDALDKLEAKEGRDAKAAAAKAAKDDARKNGALVGGSSAAATSAPAPYRAGSARNVNEAIRSMNLL